MASIAVDPRRDPLRILIVDDHRLYVEGLMRLLADDDRLEVVGQAPDGRRAVELTAELKPDIVLMDIMLPVLGGIEATREICDQNDGVRVIMLTGSDLADNVQAASEAGATAFLTKATTQEDLLETILSVASLALALGGRPAV